MTSKFTNVIRVRLSVMHHCGAAAVHCGGYGPVLCHWLTFLVRACRTQTQLASITDWLTPRGRLWAGSQHSLQSSYRCRHCATTPYCQTSSWPNQQMQYIMCVCAPGRSTQCCAQGKDKPTFAPHEDSGDVVVVVNARHVELTGRKWDKKLYRWHTG